MATHDVELAARFAQRALVVAAGRIVAEGPVSAVMRACPELASQAARIDSLLARPTGAVTEEELLRRIDPRFPTQTLGLRPGSDADA